VIATHGNTDAIVRALCESGIAAQAFRTGYGGDD
jgi:putative mRNA 3-end processing factor